ncbi:MAG TPA: replication-relaxation family protein [Patescibacteria group bacterium]|nr:replication-relaxation family protein [Patescibacteria group bacterium]
MNYRELPEITEKQREIVNLVYRFRFINRVQIQRLFHHKDAKRINTWLKDLVEKKYLGRIYSHKLLENTKPAIYYLNNNGIIWVRYEKGTEYSSDEQLDFNQIKKFYEDKHASDTFINHCISLVEIYIQFKELENPEKGIEYWFETKTELWIQKQLHCTNINEDFSEIKDLIPDAAIDKVIEKKNCVTEQSYFVLLIDDHVPRFAIRYKIDQYIKFHDENEGKSTELYFEFPILLFIFSTQQKARQMGKYIRKRLDEEYVKDMTFMVTTYEKVTTDGVSGNEKTWDTIQ